MAPGDRSRSFSITEACVLHQRQTGTLDSRGRQLRRNADASHSFFDTRPGLAAIVRRTEFTTILRRFTDSARVIADNRVNSPTGYS